MKFEKRAPQLRLKLEGWRSRVVLGLATLGFLVLAGRAVYLQGMNQQFLQAKGEARYGRVVEMPASRGPVLDRNGQMLALSTPVESICVTPDDWEADDAAVKRLAAALGMDAGEIRQKIANKDRQFVFLKRQIAPEQAAKVMALHVPGVFLQREYRRFYPAGEVMAHVVGFTGIDDNGQEGIELAQQKRLAGVAGSRKVIKDRKGNIVEDVASLRVPRDGEAVTLAIDQRLQFLAHRELRNAVAANGARAGSIVILDAKTGEVMALVNMPDYNPNNRANVTGKQTRNRSVTDLFEPGSTLKPFTVAAALDSGLVKPDTLIQTAPGSMAIGGWTISDSHPFGVLSVAQVIQKSSNVGTAKIQLSMTAERMGTLYRELGFGAVPATGFPGEAKGLLRPWTQWRPIEQATMSYGHGISVSLLQVARAYTVFTNEGQLLPLALLKREARPIGKPLFTKDTTREIVRMMEMAVSPGGTAPRAAVPGYRVGGKTGTAHKAEAGGYAEHKYVSSFVGFAPVSNPRFIVAVMIDEPSGTKYYGGDIGAPVFSTVMGAALRMMSVPPDAPGIPGAPGTINAQARDTRGEG
ncbi:peptidoglycan D,D-transpeptidase FtsI family protein [Usitatibacter palustris]|uniref:Peptidoglycan D,D-transpeptidase FtsI n=1 Tax=Usitatibacter palustris TaxID=2732487 RepID=A0A6M4H788_9PROT|nr:penicillin-binding protein 2 [Usitatibacter palustris]QJR13847.1 putative peptidoglycan D,D-transpeptidase PenA [Usitatibacter palustris]